MLDAANAEGLHIPNAYVNFLKTRNGTSYNGLMLYGAAIGKDDSFCRLDVVVMNQYHWTRGDTTVIGTSDIDIYVVAGKDGPFRRLDRPSWDTIDEFATCDELLTFIFASQVEQLKGAG